MNSPVPARLAALRADMARLNLDAWVFPSSDPHNSEYLPERWKVRHHLSGFGASVATLVVLKDKALMWADGRYWIQAEKELAGSTIDIMYYGKPEVPEWNQWCADHLPEGARLGFYGATMMCKPIRDIEEKCRAKNISLVTDTDLGDGVWPDRPPFPTTPIFAHALEFAGESAASKLGRVRSEMKKWGATAHVLNGLDDIGYLTNLRGGDVPTSPYFHAYLTVTETSATLHVHTARLTPALKQQLAAEGINLAEYGQFFADLARLAGRKVLLDPQQSNLLTAQTLKDHGCALIEKRAPSILMKAVKNATEIAHWENSQVRDGVAMVECLAWFHANVGGGTLTERAVSERISAERAAQARFRGLSFNPIPGYGPNGAMMHYGLKDGVETVIRPEGFFLLDSGGQYDDGTTDITRTMACGPLTHEQKLHYTLVLKGMINLSRAVFMQGTRGVQLDILARQPLWNIGINYACGTGHGVGFFNNVHEGPHNLSPRPVDQAIVPGMVVTCEPGVYLQDRYGIRIENMLLCVDHGETEHGKFHAFKPMTLCPIDTQPILRDVLGSEETAYLNAYHQKVWEKLSPHVSGAALAWLKVACREV